MGGEPCLVAVGGDDRVGGPGQRADGGFHLERFDEVPADLDRVITAPEEREFAGLVEASEIAGAITCPAVVQPDEARRRQLRILVVTGRYMCGFDDDLARAADRQIVPVRVDDPDVLVRRRHAHGDGAGLDVPLRREQVEGQVADLRCACPATEDSVGQDRVAGQLDVGAVRRLTAGRQQSQGFDGVVGRQLTQPGSQQRRGAVRGGRLLRDEPVPKSGRGAAADVPEQHGRPVEQAHRERVEAAAETEGQQDDGAVVGSHAEEATAVPGVIDRHLLRQHHAFGGAGRARGEQQDRRIVRAGLVRDTRLTWFSGIGCGLL